MALLGPAPLAYMAGALMLSVAVLAAWTWSVPRHGELRQRGAGPGAAGPGQRPRLCARHGRRPRIEATIVGTITNMADCRWADRAAAPAEGAYVHVGQKFALSPGRLEITYRAGANARVTLRRPSPTKSNPRAAVSYRLAWRPSTRCSGRQRTSACIPLFKARCFRFIPPLTSWSITAGSSACWSTGRDRLGRASLDGYVEVQYPDGATTDNRRFWPDRSSWAYVQAGPGQQVRRAIFGAGTPPLVAAILAGPNDRRTASAGGPLRFEAAGRGGLTSGGSESDLL